MKVSEIFENVRDEMNDDGTRLPSPILLRYANMAVREIVRLAPKSGSETRDLTLVAGVTQTIPSDAVLLIDLVCNVGGSTISRAIREDLDSYTPNWRNEPAIAEVEEYVYDPEQQPRSFLVSPPQPASPGQVEAIISVIPASITDSVNDDFPLSSEYANAAIAFMCHKAHKSETGEGSANDSAASYATFLSSLGVSSSTRR